MENPLCQNLLFLVMADVSAIGPQRVNGLKFCADFKVALPKQVLPVIANHLK